MKEKIILITGATGGIGKATAIELARQQATVIIHGRDRKKTMDVVNDIKKESGNNRVDFLVADLFLLSDVRKMADEFHQTYKHLDVLINNAGGIMSIDRRTTPEGLETTMAVNLFAPFLLTNLLLDALKKSSDGRIINLSSNSHQLNARPDFSDLQNVNAYSPLVAYGNAKLFLIWISQYLDKDLKRQGIHNISINTVHPGAVATAFGTTSNLGFLNVVAKVVRPFMKSVEKGAETIIYLATSEDVKHQSGNYYVNKKIRKTSQKYYSQKNEEAIWNYCEEMTKS
jgi:NAD(P)-dependent dehydrogenase (short-subunit alcohol dehydrogenase family)